MPKVTIHLGQQQGMCGEKEKAPALESCHSPARGNNSNFGKSDMAGRIISLKAQADIAFKHCDMLGHDCFMLTFNETVQRYNFTFGFLPSFANNARSLSCEGGAMKIIYGFKSEFRRVFKDY